VVYDIASQAAISDHLRPVHLSPRVIEIVQIRVNMAVNASCS
jgi:hypothetical protein